MLQTPPPTTSGSNTNQNLPCLEDFTSVNFRLCLTLQSSREALVGHCRLQAIYWHSVCSTTGVEETLDLTDEIRYQKGSTDIARTPRRLPQSKIDMQVLPRNCNLEQDLSSCCSRGMGVFQPIGYDQNQFNRLLPRVFNGIKCKGLDLKYNGR